MPMVSFADLTESQRDAAAEILVTALDHSPSAWADLDAARTEVASFFADPARLAIAALDAGELVGWVGAIQHSAHLWELHPLVVHPDRQGQGHGTGLVTALEKKARASGVCTLWLGTDDDFGGTNLFGADLYPGVLERLQVLAPTAGHPFTFYRRMGYEVVGVLPDATGFGRPDILMAKRIGGGPAPPAALAKAPTSP